MIDLKNIIVRLSNEILITPGGLSMVGHLIGKTSLYEKADALKTKERANPKIKNSDVLGSYIGMLSQGKPEYGAVNELKEEPEYYGGMLGIKMIPSEETLRQRLDQLGPQLPPVLVRTNVELLKNAKVAPTNLERVMGAENRQAGAIDKCIPIDIDVSPFDNSNSKKEGVSPTYKKTMGFAPIFAYIGTEGYLLGAELREGSQHSQKGTAVFLEESIRNAYKIACGPFLLRMDSGNDSADNLAVCFAVETRAGFIIKRNLRNESHEDWVAYAKNDAGATVANPREGKTVYTGSNYHDFEELAGESRAVRIVYEITERTATAGGQMLIEPGYEIDTWWVSFPEEGEGSATDADVIRAYHGHGACEQFHSEIKTDMDLERLPSGCFKTNAAILLLGMIAYNILRIIGQHSLTENDSPLKRPVQRRRLRTVIQNLITLAVRVVRHARRIYLNLGRGNAWRYTFLRVHKTIAFNDA